MGRNSGSKVFMTYVATASNDHTVTWYCQQHAKFDHVNSTTPTSASSTWGSHVFLNSGPGHGAVEQ